MFCTAAAIALAVAMTSGSTATQQPPAADQALVAKARAIHDRVITLDTHVDIGVNDFTAECNYAQDTATQVNLPKMIKGGLDLAFFIVYVGQNRSPEAFTKPAFDRAYAEASAKFDAIHRLTKEYAPDKIGLALTSDDVRRLNKEGKKIAMIGVENGYPLGDESTAVERVREFQKRGARYLSLAHNGHSQLADSNTGEANNEWLHNGLSPLGRTVIEELNRVGIMVDISHPSKQANLQAMAMSKVPVIASHSGARAVQDHSRNLDDEQLLALKKNGGVAQAVALASYVKVHQPSAERNLALAKLPEEFKVPAAAVGRGGGPGGGRGQREGVRCPSPQAQPGARGAGGGQGRGGGGGRGGTALAELTDEQRAELQKRMVEINTKYPAPGRANVKDFVDHIDYILKKIGIDHVGISSDFDGGGGVDGWNDASETFNVTLELVRRGYTEEQIAKIWSGNLLRVLDQVQKYARTQK
jgi:membrane dipeptidase